MFSPVSQNLKYIFNQLVVGRLRGPESPVSPRHITRDNSHIQRTQLLRKYIKKVIRIVCKDVCHLAVYLKNQEKKPSIQSRGK